MRCIAKWTETRCPNEDNCRDISKAYCNIEAREVHRMFDGEILEYEGSLGYGGAVYHHEIRVNKTRKIELDEDYYGIEEGEDCIAGYADIEYLIVGGDLKRGSQEDLPKEIRDYLEKEWEARNG